MRHAVAALLVVAFAASGALAGATCAGWQSTPSARLACCQAAGHPCGDQAAADLCCGGTQQAQQHVLKSASAKLAAPLAASVVVPRIDLAWIVGHAALVSFQRSLDQRRHEPPLLRNRVLRI